MEASICVVVSSALTVNAFLLEPLKKLGTHYRLYIVVNDSAASISDELEGVEVLSVPIVRKIKPVADLRALFQLYRIFRKHRFTAVQSVTPKAGLLSMLAAYFAGTETRIHIFTGQVWVTRRGLSRWVLKQMDRLIASFASEILVDSVSQHRFLLEQRVVSAAKSCVLADGSISGVNVTRFKPDAAARSRIRHELNICDGDIVFLFIGRLNRDKGVLDMASAFAGLEDERARLMLVGPDEAGMREQMEQMLGDCLQRVHFVGFSDRPESYMAAGDVLCLPSYREGFGSVIIEAAAVGIPSIGSRIYGVEDAITDEYSGLLFEAGNREQLQTCMTAVMSRPELLKQLGENARARIFEKFTSETVASAWLDYYRARV